MNISNIRILFAAQFSAPYMGNFLNSLIHLENELKQRYNVECAYLLPAKASAQNWYKNFASNHKVYLSGDDKTLIYQNEANSIISNFRPAIIHTHFEGYDIPMYGAVMRCRINASVVWHMHDYLSYHANIIKKIYQKWCYFKHYGIPMMGLSREKRPSIIAVCNSELRFIKNFRLGAKIKQQVIPNGIDLARLKILPRTKSDIFRFLAFGGRNISKRTDLIIKSLIKVNKRVELTIVGGDEIKSIANALIDKLLPPPTHNKKTCEFILKIIATTDNVSKLYANADCFISSSAYETFSYAVAEATIAGLPVIQSDIEGTKWNSKNPSTFEFISGDVNSLADVIERVLDEDSDELEQKCIKTAAANRDKFSLQSWCNNIIEFYESL